MAVGRIPNPGDGVTAARLFGKHAAQQVQLVRTGDGDKDIVVLNARLGQGSDGRTVAHHAQHVVGLNDLLDAGLVGVNHRYAVPFLTELAGQSCAHLAAAHKYDFHPLSILSHHEKKPGGLRRLARRSMHGSILAQFSGKVHTSPQDEEGFPHPPAGPFSTKCPGEQRAERTLAGSGSVGSVPSRLRRAGRRTSGCRSSSCTAGSAGSWTSTTA